MTDPTAGAVAELLRPVICTDDAVAMHSHRVACTLDDVRVRLTIELHRRPQEHDCAVLRCGVRRPVRRRVTAVLLPPKGKDACDRHELSAGKCWLARRHPPTSGRPLRRAVEGTNSRFVRGLSRRPVIAYFVLTNSSLAITPGRTRIKPSSPIGTCRTRLPVALAPGYSSCPPSSGSGPTTSLS